jgi:adenylate cyclase
MSNPHEAGTTTWRAEPICEWLLSEGRLLPDIDDVIQQLGQHLLAAGAPIWRLLLSIQTVHPILTAHTSIWERDDATVQPIETEHGIETRSEFIGSPFETIVLTEERYRKNLSEPLTDADHVVLHELKARGGTDYFGMPLRFAVDAGAILVFNTDSDRRFSEADIRHFETIAKVLAPIAEVFRLKRVSVAVAHAYLGTRTGMRVLQGQITRGHVEKINAAIMISDIRDWTGLNNQYSSDTALSHANQYFEIIADAIESSEGEILKFTGDGILAIFPLSDNGMQARTVCARALAAAEETRVQASNSDLLTLLDFGIGMHFGEVLYGNIGSQTRLDFTVMGQAVNTAARLESLTGKLDTPILFSEEFARQLDRETVLIAEQTLKGYDVEIKVMSMADH